MNALEITEGLKTIIKFQTQSMEEIPVSFFDEKKDNIISIMKMMYPAFSGLDSITMNGYYETAVREFRTIYQVGVSPSSALTKSGFQSWLTPERKDKIPTHYIDRYLLWLRKGGRSENVITEISRSSESILGKMGDPHSPNSFYTKGLVVGSVQSGKTGNFNAVINRAIDAGYNLVIILSGIMEDLRRQTQLRLEMDVIGEGMINAQTGRLGAVGVGTINPFGMMGNRDIPQVITITSPNADFKKGMQDANFSMNQKNLLVCKKNTGVLKNLLLWLSDYLAENTLQHSIPLLIIDDEADNASLNNLGHKGREYASIINGHIRAILGLFSRKTYLGYTATPFANVLQDRNEEASGPWPVSFRRNGETIIKHFRQVDNLFPDDFIELLESPSNYIGAKQLFDSGTDTGTTRIPLVEAITDFSESFPSKLVESGGLIRIATEDDIENRVPGLRSARRDDIYPQVLPESMKDAISCFVLGIAIRMKRRPAMINSMLFNAHNTMLIHISRFTFWQNRTRDLVRMEVDSLLQRTLDLPTSPDSIYAKLEKVWNRYYSSIVENIRTYLPEGYADEFLTKLNFEDIRSLLPAAVKDIEVRAINSLTDEKLVYSTDVHGIGKKYIAIGGNRLSRGFTLEGLTINYFIRDTNYADTLLQMGRWFGYRPGYIDCCKLFTTGDAIEKFNASTRTIEELETRFKKMEREGKTPDDFILYVKAHPGVIEITRPSILKNAVSVSWSYQDKLEQSTEFRLDDKLIKDAWENLKNLFEKHQKAIRTEEEFFILDTDTAGLYDFLDAKNTFSKFREQIGYMKRFIDLCQENRTLRRWRIAVKRKGRGERLESHKSGLPDYIDMSVRSGPSGENNSVFFLEKMKQQHLFTGSGSSANIVTGGKDMSVWLTPGQIQKAEEEFLALKKEELKKENKNISETALDARAKKFTKPERIYREKMSEDQGLLVIYLMDLREVFKEQSNNGLSQLAERLKIDVSIPLIGYAIGFPPIAGDIGGIYLKGDYNINEDENEEYAEEFDYETLNSPEE